jgi:putative membrane protein
MGGSGMMAGFGWLGILTTVLFWAGVILLVVWAVRNTGASQRPTSGPDALEILKQRYARGEISRDEFEQGRELVR